MAYPNSVGLVEQSRVEATAVSEYEKSRILTHVARAEGHTEGVLAGLSTADECAAGQNLAAVNSIRITYWRRRNPAAARAFAEEPWHLVAQYP
jgi:hypothetical protein